MGGRLIVGAAGVLLLVGCGSGNPTTADLAEDVGCEQLTPVPETAFSADHGREAGACSMGGELTSVSTFSSQDARDEWLGEMEATPGLAFVLGDEWAILTNVEQASAVADATDGVVR